MKNSKSAQAYEVALAEVSAAQKHQVAFRNDWQDYIAQNEPCLEAAEHVVLARAGDTLAILAEDAGAIDEFYSIVVLTSDLVIDDGVAVDWVQT